MSDIILKIENLSKQYRLGLIGRGTIGDDLKRWWYNVRGKDNPFLKIGDVNVRSSKANSDYVWAIQDINFEVKRGEVLGIIGKNGAGKSTLLKILSRVTNPTTGQIKTKGRIASLLEVGTGFHPEMTGRENIFLNGAILGMTKEEIRSKIDEIIDFSGCERYIDTPVKRYSSGMTVRLAFAVAAYLEPDILVIDEVLAVGDAEFQKKAIGKMQDISRGEGRTVLFVSHNMVAVKSLCTRVIVLDKGSISFNGGVNEALNLYKKIFNPDLVVRKDTNELNVEVLDFSKNVGIQDDLFLKLRISNNKLLDFPLCFDIGIRNEMNENVLHFKMDYTSNSLDFKLLKDFNVILNIKKPNLLPGDYFIDIYFYDKIKVFYWVENFYEFNVVSRNTFTNNKIFNNLQAHTLPEFSYEVV